MAATVRSAQQCKQLSPSVSRSAQHRTAQLVVMHPSKFNFQFPHRFSRLNDLKSSRMLCKIKGTGTLDRRAAVLTYLSETAPQSAGKTEDPPHEWCSSNTSGLINCNSLTRR